MPTATEQTLTVHDLYAMRDNIGLSRKECKQPPRTRSLFEWGKAQQAYYLDNLLWSITSPPVVYIWEPVDGSSKGAVLDGRQRLKAIFSYLDGNYPLGKTMPGGWAGKTYNRLLATSPHLAETILQTPIQVVTIQALSYWEAAIATYPEICGHCDETVEREQWMLQSYLADGSRIFASKEQCDQRVRTLEDLLSPSIPYMSNFHADLLAPNREFLEMTRWQVEAIKFVARHHHRGVIPC